MAGSGAVAVEFCSEVRKILHARAF